MFQLLIILHEKKLYRQRVLHLGLNYLKLWPLVKVVNVNLVQMSLNCDD